jgi:hypothetical protein
MIEIFENFGELLDERFELGVVTTEDSVRYTFFAALLQAGVKPHQVVLEYPHPSIERAKIDTWIPSYKEGSVAFEFKYDRDPPGGKSQPKTQKAGYVFKDLRRQVKVAKGVGIRSYFIYVTSEEMAVYFRNPNNGYAELWELIQGGKLKIDENYFSNKPETFMNTLGGTFQAYVVGTFSRALPGGNYLRAYEVLPNER